MPDSAASIVRTFEADVRRRLMAGVRNGRTLPELEAELRATIRDIAPQRRLQRLLESSFNAMRRSAAEEIRIEFVADRTPGDFPLSSGLVATTLTGWSRLEARMETSVITALDGALRSGKGFEHIENLIASKMGVARHQAETLANTGIAQVSRATRVEVGMQAGLDRMRYAGPSSHREKCREWLEEARRGVTYTIAEIRQLDNQQGLPVLTSCGGYNCIHRWTFVV